jgi:hypothetical protein
LQEQVSKAPGSWVAERQEMPEEQVSQARGAWVSGPRGLTEEPVPCSEPEQRSAPG